MVWPHVGTNIFEKVIMKNIQRRLKERIFGVWMELWAPCYNDIKYTEEDFKGRAI